MKNGVIAFQILQDNIDYERKEDITIKDISTRASFAASQKGDQAKRL